MGSRREFLEAARVFGRVAFDTSCCIYYLQKDSPRWPLIVPLMERAVAGLLLVELSAIVRMELLVLPYKARDTSRISLVRRFTDDYPGIVVAPLSEPVLELAAEVRAATGLKTPDALVVGSAVLNECDAIVGNDAAFKRLNARGELPFVSLGGQRHRMPRYLHLDDYADGQ